MMVLFVLSVGGFIYFVVMENNAIAGFEGVEGLARDESELGGYSGRVRDIFGWFVCGDEVFWGEECDELDDVVL